LEVAWHCALGTVTAEIGLIGHLIPTQNSPTLTTSNKISGAQLASRVSHFGMKIFARFGHRASGGDFFWGNPFRWIARTLSGHSKDDYYKHIDTKKLNKLWL